MEDIFRSAIVETLANAGIVIPIEKVDKLVQAMSNHPQQYTITQIIDLMIWDVIKAHPDLFQKDDLRLLYQQLLQNKKIPEKTYPQRVRKKIPALPITDTEG